MRWNIDSVQAVREELAEFDFAVVNLSGGDRKQLAEQLMEFAAVAGLGEPYVPELYRSGTAMRFSSGFNLNDVGGPNDAGGHPAFSQNAELDPHTDGTLEPIGKIQTSILVCVQPALSGGQTIVLRTAAVLETMSVADRQAIKPLFESGALRRHATVNGRNDYSDGPVFAMEGERVIGRYCVSPRDEWRFEEVLGLREARHLFEGRLAMAEGAHSEVPLAAGQALIMNNSRVSHARRHFQSAPGAPRYLLRGLFCRNILAA